MLFTSSTFLFAFLPVFFCVYFALPTLFARNCWLLLASLVFYSWGEPVYVALMVVSIVLNWGLGLAIGNAEGDSRKRRTLLILAVVANLGIIGFFKYEGFIADLVNGVLGASVVPNLMLPLPIGISFYTLQALSYVVDVYRAHVEPQQSPLLIGMYIASFPQLVAGPIVRYSTICDQVLDRRETLAGFAAGLRLFIIGMAKKTLLSNVMAILATDMLAMGGAKIGAVGAWSGLLAYTFQIYFDFAGYSDMAIGLGRMMGFEYLRNFNYPYISTSITEFWRRWHISLSSFFRDYVYIPLGGSRCSAGRNALNIAIVWALTGLWHGAAWNYVGWGVYYGALLLLEKYVWGRALKRAPRPLRHVYTIAVFVFGWSFFWITDAPALVSFWKALGFSYGLTGSSTLWELEAWEYLPVFLTCVLAATPIAPFVKERVLAWLERRPAGSVMEGVCNPRHSSVIGLAEFVAQPQGRTRAIAYQVLAVCYDAVLVALFVASVASIVSGSFNPFIYFQF